MQVLDAPSAVTAGNWFSRARRYLTEFIPARLRPGESVQATAFVGIHVAYRHRVDAVQDGFEGDALAMEIEIAHLEAGLRHLRETQVYLSDPVVMLETACLRKTVHAKHRLVQLWQETQMRIHAIEAQIDRARGTERRELDARLARVRQQYGECTSQLNKVCGLDRETSTT
jgi:hypothetical protein